MTHEARSIDGFPTLDQPDPLVTQTAGYKPDMPWGFRRLFSKNTP